MARAFFIDETYLKNYSPLSGNVEIKELYPFVLVTEDIYIQEAIGTSLYNDLITKITADNDLSGYPNELILVGKIRDVVMWYTCYDAIPFLATKLRNIGVVNQTGDNLTTSSDAKENKLRKECKDKGDFYLKRLQAYLCDYESLFPAYDQGTKDDLDPNTSAPTSTSEIAFDRNTHDDIDTRFYRKWLKS